MNVEIWSSIIKWSIATLTLHKKWKNKQTGFYGSSPWVATTTSKWLTIDFAASCGPWNSATQIVILRGGLRVLHRNRIGELCSSAALFLGLRVREVILGEPNSNNCIKYLYVVIEISPQHILLLVHEVIPPQLNTGYSKITLLVIWFKCRKRRKLYPLPSEKGLVSQRWTGVHLCARRRTFQRSHIMMASDCMWSHVQTAQSACSEILSLPTNRFLPKFSSPLASMCMMDLWMSSMPLFWNHAFSHDVPGTR